MVSTFPCDHSVGLPQYLKNGYFTKPSAQELEEREFIEPGYCSRVRDFVVGRLKFGWVRFFGETDIRFLNIEKIVEFGCSAVTVYRDEEWKPPIGDGLNKPAEVTLLVDRRYSCKGFEKLKEKLRRTNEKQGAEFVSFDENSFEWSFTVPHFSRFGLDLDEDNDEDEEEENRVPFDVSFPSWEKQQNVVDEMETEGDTEEPPMEDGYNVDLVSDDDSDMFRGFQGSANQAPLVHSLPEHLGLDPIKVQEMKAVLFEEDNEDEADVFHFPASTKDLGEFDKARRKLSHKNSPLRESAKRNSSQKSWQVSSYQGKHHPPLLGYPTKGPSPMLMTHQSKAEYVALKRPRLEGFRLDSDKIDCPVSKHVRNLVDASLFMGKSFRVGWGPNGTFVHCGRPVGMVNDSAFGGLSSEIHIQTVAIDRTVRDEGQVLKEDFVEMQFRSPLKLHKSLSVAVDGIENFPSKLKLRKVVCERTELANVCAGYEEFIAKELTVARPSKAKQVLLMHQIVVWHLISVLFSENERKCVVLVDKGDAMEDGKDGTSASVDSEAEPLIRRAVFSSWVRDSVDHRVREEISSLEEGSDLKRIFSLLTGRQLEEAVQLAAFRADVRLACLISQAGGSMMNRQFMAAQLEAWQAEGLDFSFIEDERLSLFKLIAGDIQGALGDRKIDWKRYLGLLMWYGLPPDSHLKTIIQCFEQLVIKGEAPKPVPIYIDEGPLEEASPLNVGNQYDMTYYLMLLHAKEKLDDIELKRMFTSFSFTYDALDYHMAWHQQSILQAISALDSKDLHIVYMSFVSQLLCVGECHWAIYVVLHMPPSTSCPLLHEKVIKEILFQYCEKWNASETQKQFLKELSIPMEWMHEALAIYCQYNGNDMEALGHLLQSFQWQKAHSLFVSSVAPVLYCSSERSDILRLATAMELHKSEIADWDLGAGIFIDYYNLRNQLKDNHITSNGEDLEAKYDACRDFFARLKQSLALWKSKFSLNARVAYSRMADDIAMQLLSESKLYISTKFQQRNCLSAIMDAPVPEDLRLFRLQDAVTVFTSWILETTT
eukprot:TRINITY_DN4144_c0_g1_i1.p1 TRINITY_DN4144_c0_g1~~TRINITY_DN4144_c0_g1_i1.p1  ORF type:complete len:1049 (-),score=219.23 TRINITY_DN4144_c0_g1_i1:149-3295(-)